MLLWKGVINRAGTESFWRHGDLYAVPRCRAAQQTTIHVYYGEYEAVVAIDGELLAGSLPHRQLKIIIGWLAYHEEEAYKAWNLAVKGEHFDKIPPMN